MANIVYATDATERNLWLCVCVRVRAHASCALYAILCCRSRALPFHCFIFRVRLYGYHQVISSCIRSAHTVDADAHRTSAHTCARTQSVICFARYVETMPAAECTHAPVCVCVCVGMEGVFVCVRAPVLTGLVVTCTHL